MKFKNTFPVLTLMLGVILAFVLFTDTASAQNPVNISPNTVATGYSFPMPVKQYPESTLVKIYANRVDTLYAKYWINRTSAAYQTPEFYRLGYFNRSSVTIDVTDSSSTGIVIKYRNRNRLATGGAASTWSTALTDSFVCVTASGTVKEFSLVDTDSDLFDALDVDVMFILTTNAWSLDYTANLAGTLKRQVRLNYAP